MIYCLLLSLVGGELLLALIGHFQLSGWTLLFCTGHGLAVAIFWKRGVRWCEQRLRVRPARSFDPAQPYAGLDLG